MIRRGLPLTLLLLLALSCGAGGDPSAPDLDMDVHQPDARADFQTDASHRQCADSQDCDGGFCIDGRCEEAEDCRPCADGASCEEGADCLSQVCVDQICQSPRCGDGVINQPEEVCDPGADATGGRCSDDCTQMLCEIGVDTADFASAILDERCAGVYFPVGRHEVSMEWIGQSRHFRIVGEDRASTVLTAPEGERVLWMQGSTGGLSLENVTIEGARRSQDFAGAVMVQGGLLFISDATFRDNQARRGAALEISGASSVVDILRSSFSNNLAGSGGGGAIYIVDGTMTMRESIVEENSLTLRSTDRASGAGILSRRGTVRLEDSSLRRNIIEITADGVSDDGLAWGAGIDALQTDLELTNVIVEENEIRVTSLAPTPYTVAALGAGVSLRVTNAALEDVEIRGNRLHLDTSIFSAAFGGGLYVIGGPVLLTRVRIQENRITGASSAPAVCYGAGTYIDYASDLDATDVEWSENEIDVEASGGLARGGGLAVQRGTGPAGLDVTIRQALFAGNRARFTGDDVLQSSTAEGGGLYLSGGFEGTGRFRLVNATISQNSTNAGGVGYPASLGGGVSVRNPETDNYTLDAALRNITIAGNEAVGDGNAFLEGGGLHVRENPTLRVQNSILSSNSAGPASDCSDAEEILQMGDYNLVEAPMSCASAMDQTDLAGVLARLGPLADHQGFTRTHWPEPESAAIDGGNPAGCVDALGLMLNVDQRGYPRSDDRCDIGAVEVD